MFASASVWLAAARCTSFPEFGCKARHAHCAWLYIVVVATHRIRELFGEKGLPVTVVWLVGDLRVCRSPMSSRRGGSRYLQQTQNVYHQTRQESRRLHLVRHRMACGKQSPRHPVL